MLLKEMAAYEPISSTGPRLSVWDHTGEVCMVCDPYGSKFMDFSSGVIAGCGNSPSGKV